MTNRAQRIRARRAKVARIDQKIDKWVKSATYRLSWHHFLNARVTLSGKDYIGVSQWIVTDEEEAQAEEAIDSGEFPVTRLHERLRGISTYRAQVMDFAIRRSPFFRFALENGFDLAIEYELSGGELTVEPYIIIDRKARFKEEPDFYYVHNGDSLEGSLVPPKQVEE